MKLQVVPNNRFKVGKFGGSFVNIHRTINNPTPGSEVFLRERSASLRYGVFGVEGLYPCLPSFRQEPQNRPYYAIENGTDIPTVDCQGQEGFRKFTEKFLNPINEEDDPYLNTDPDKDYKNSDYDVMSSKNAGEIYQSSTTKTNWNIVSGIEFSLAPDIHENFNPYFGTKLKIYWSFDDGAGKQPEIVTDGRNNEYINVANSNGVNPTYWANSRIYLEIRHDLNTMDYSYIVENMDGWVKTKKKNSFIVSRFVSAYDGNVFRNPNDYYRDPDAGPGIPRGRCSILFLADM